LKPFGRWTNGFRARTKNQVVVESLALRREWDPTDRWPNPRPDEAASLVSADTDDLVATRVNGAVEVAGQFETGVELESLVDLLPEHGPATVSELTGWFHAHPDSGRVTGGHAVDPTAADLVFDGERRERAEQYYQAAVRLFDSALQGSRPWLRCLAVTGSTAYGDPKAGDDCDFMAIVRRGSVWVFVAYVFLRLRLRAWTRPSLPEPVWCFNYMLDEDTAIREFSRPRGFLFAREALVARPVEGEAYYRGLLRRGRWLRDEAPRLYARWESAPMPNPGAPESASPAARVLNVVLFPVVAAYLQLKGLWANHRLRRSGREAETFRTITRPGQMSLATRKFERLVDRMAPANRAAPE
jgi:hypothetical protein